MGSGAIFDRGTALRSSDGDFALTPPLPFWRSSICRRPRAGITRSASMAIPICTTGSDGRSSAAPADRRTMSCAVTPASTSPTEACRTSGSAGLLQPAGRHRAAHEGGQIRAELDAALMHALGGKANDTMVKMAPIFRFCASVVCSANISTACLIWPERSPERIAAARSLTPSGATKILKHSMGFSTLS